MRQSWYKLLASAALIVRLSCAQTVQGTPTSHKTDFVGDEISAKLLAAKRIYVESFGDDEINRTLQAMVIDSLRTSQRFIVTENKEKADLIMKGSSLEKTTQEAHSLGSSTAVGSAAGSHYGIISGSGGSIFGSSGGSFIGRTLGISDSGSVASVKMRR